MRKSRGKIRKVICKTESVKVSEKTLTLTWTIDQLLGEVAGEIEAFSAQIGLRIMHAVMDHEVGAMVGPWGRQSAYRHGAQPGNVVYGGRKVGIERARIRGKGGGEIGLDTYRALHRQDNMRAAVARQLTLRCSARDYAGAIEDCLDGYGISRSSVSRQWKSATEKELKKLCQRPMSEGLVGLLLDGSK